MRIPEMFKEMIINIPKDLNIVLPIFSIIVFPFLLTVSLFRPSYKREIDLEQLDYYLQRMPYQKVGS